MSIDVCGMTTKDAANQPEAGRNAVATERKTMLVHIPVWLALILMAWPFRLARKSTIGRRDPDAPPRRRKKALPLLEGEGR